MNSNQPDLPNYNILIVIIFGALFLLSAISYLKITRNIPIDQIQDPYTKSQLIEVQYLCGLVMLLVTITFILYAYSISKK